VKFFVVDPISTPPPIKISDGAKGAVRRRNLPSTERKERVEGKSPEGGVGITATIFLSQTTVGRREFAVAEGEIVSHLYSLCVFLFRPTNMSSS
jgi:hypothetical protein